MERLRTRATQQVAENARNLRAGRWWDLPAKVQVAHEIYDQELARSMAGAKAAGLKGAGDTRFDALRHARASKRLAETAGARFAEVAGIVHEGDDVLKHPIPAFARQGVGGPYGVQSKDGLTPGQVIDEIRMDLHNNAEGRAAAREHRRIEPGRLRIDPTTAPLTALYRSPPASWAGLPPR